MAAPRDICRREDGTLQVRLNAGHWTLIDEVDLSILLDPSRNWEAKNSPSGPFYVASRKMIAGIRRTTMLHRLLLGDIPEGYVVDHANRNGLDNRRANLRLATPSQNTTNRKQMPTETGFRGVFRTYRGDIPFRSYIRVEGKQRFLGLFQTAEEAAAAFDAAALTLRGEFAVLNFPGQAAASHE